MHKLMLNVEIGSFDYLNVAPTAQLSCTNVLYMLTVQYVAIRRLIKSPSPLVPADPLHSLPAAPHLHFLQPQAAILQVAALQG